MSSCASSLSHQSTCLWVWWWCTSCCAPSTKWLTCMAWPPSCSCPAVRRLTKTRTGSPLWRPTTRRRRPRTTQKNLPANPWSRDHSRRTTPSTKAEQRGSGGNTEALPLAIASALAGWISKPLSFFYFVVYKWPDNINIIRNWDLWDSALVRGLLKQTLCSHHIIFCTL